MAQRSPNGVIEIIMEKGIPIPDHTRRGAPSKYRFEELEVGESILVVGANSRTHSGITSPWRKKLGHDYLSRTIIYHLDGNEKNNSPDNLVDALRIWRTA